MRANRRNDNESKRKRKSTGTKIKPAASIPLPLVYRYMNSAAGLAQTLLHGTTGKMTLREDVEKTRTGTGATF